MEFANCRIYLWVNTSTLVPFLHLKLAICEQSEEFGIQKRGDWLAFNVSEDLHEPSPAINNPDDRVGRSATWQVRQSDRLSRFLPTERALCLRHFPPSPISSDETYPSESLLLLTLPSPHSSSNYPLPSVHFPRATVKLLLRVTSCSLQIFLLGHEYSIYI